MSKASLRRLLKPRHVAVIGGKEAAEVIRQCQRIGFDGELWAVNPKQEHLAGLKTYARVKDLPQAPDASFVALSREKSIDVVEALAQMGAGGVVCYASGFAEVGGAGTELQKRLQRVMGDLALVGPNCYGLLNYLDGLALWPDHYGGERLKLGGTKGVAVIMQSGNLALNLSMQDRSLPLAYLISVGNQAGLAIHDYVAAFLEDEAIGAIGLHIEGLTDIPAFAELALKALKHNCPIVVLKTGRSQTGQAITMSHTSSLAGEDRLYDSLFERYGIARAQDLAEFIELLKGLNCLGSLPKASLASISCSGGEAALIADLAENYGLSFPKLTVQQQQELQEILGDKVELNNPLDYHTYIWGDEAAQERCFRALVQGEQGVTVKILDYPQGGLDKDVSAWDKTLGAFARALPPQKGLLVSNLPENLPQKARATLLKAGIAPMQGLNHALKTIQAAHHLYQRQSQSDLKPLLNRPKPQGEAYYLDEWQAKQQLAHYGLSVPRGLQVTRKRSSFKGECVGFSLGVEGFIGGDFA
ncbi:MAG: CoA-binding protein [Deinococcales bacterium]